MRLKEDWQRSFGGDATKDFLRTGWEGVTHPSRLILPVTPAR